MDEEIAKQTQKEIDRAFPDGCEKPNIPLKHLSKPPFRLVFDILLSFSRQFGILSHTIGEEEKTYDPYWKEADKATKVAFLERIITVIKEVSSKPLTVRASKITSGSEPEKTNELLQVLARTAVSTPVDIWNGVELKLKNLLTTPAGAEDKSASSDGGGSNDKEKHLKERKHKRHHREKMEKRLTQPDDTTTTSSSTTPTIEVQAAAATLTEEPHMASGSSNGSSAVEASSVAQHDLTNSLGVDRLEVESNGSSVSGGPEPTAKERKVKKKHSSSRSTSKEKKKHKHHKDKEKNGSLSASTDFSASDSLDTNNVATHSASSESSQHHNGGAEGENNHVVTSEGGEECGAPHDSGHGKKEKHRKKKRSSSKSTDSKTSHHSKAPVAQSSLASRPLAEPNPEWEALLSNLSTFNNKANTFMSEYDSRRIPQAAEIENLQQDDQDGTLSSRPNSATNEFRSIKGIEAAIELQVQRIKQSNSFLEEHNELLVIIKGFVPDKKDENE